MPVPIPVFIQPMAPPIGLYRATHSFGLVATQAQNSRVFQIRNPHATRKLVVTRMFIQWIQTGAHTATILGMLNLWKLTGFSAVDTTNTTTLVGNAKRNLDPAAPGSALLRGVTASGVAAGMTGGTMTRPAPLVQIPMVLLATLPTAGPVPFGSREAIATRGSEEPIVLGPDEGIGLENAITLGAAAGAHVFVDIDWIEVDTF